MIGVRRKKEEEAEKDIRTQNQAVLVGFRAAYVFDVSRDRRQPFRNSPSVSQATLGSTATALWIS